MAVEYSGGDTFGKIRSLGGLALRAAREGLFDREKTSKEWMQEYSDVRMKGGNGRYAMVGGVFRAVSDIIHSSGIVPAKYFDHPIDIAQLSFDFGKRFNTPEKIGEGTNKRVYLIRPKEHEGYLGKQLVPFVVTWDKCALHGNENPEVLAARYLAARSWIEETYKAMPEIFIKEHVRVMPIAKREKSAVIVTVSEYVEGPLVDFLEAVRNDFLEKLTHSKHQKLRALVEKFLDATLEEFDRTGLIVDLLGNNNVALVSEGDSFKLKILDQHTLHMNPDIPKGPEDSLHEEIQIAPLSSANSIEIFRKNISLLRHMQKWLNENPIASE